MKKREPHYYQIRRSMFWGMIGLLAGLIGTVYFRADLYAWWIHSQGREAVSFVGMESMLENKEECLLCGHSSQSLKERYGEADGMGVISLNDWYVLEFQLKARGKDGAEAEMNRGLSTTFGNTGIFTYYSKSNPTRGMASIEITLPDDFSLDPEMIQNNLCQECLNRIGESLSYSKWKNEKKEAVPLCLVDLKTLEIYSLQDWHKGCMIRDHWIEIETGKETIEIKSFPLLSSDMQ